MATTTYTSLSQTGTSVRICAANEIPADNSPGVQPGYLLFVPATSQLYIAVEKVVTDGLTVTKSITFVKAAAAYVAP